MMDEILLLSQQLNIRILPITLVLLISIFKVEAIAFLRILVYEVIFNL